MGVFRIDEDIPMHDSRLLHAEYDPRQVFRVTELPNSMQPVSMWIPRLYDETALHILVSLPPAQAAGSSPTSIQPVAPPRRAVRPDVALATGAAAAAASQYANSASPSQYASPASPASPLDYYASPADPPHYSPALSSSEYSSAYAPLTAAAMLKPASMADNPFQPAPPVPPVSQAQSAAKGRIATPVPAKSTGGRFAAFMRTTKGRIWAGVIGTVVLVAIIIGVVVGMKSSKANGSDAQAVGGSQATPSSPVTSTTRFSTPLASSAATIPTPVPAASTTSRPIASPTPLPGNWLTLAQFQFMGTPLPGPAATVTLRTPDLMGCGTLCRAAAGCLAGQMVGNTCYLMKSFDGTAVTNVDAMITYPDVSGFAAWSAAVGSDSDGHDFDPTGTCPPATSGAQCAALCAVIPACRGVNYNSAVDGRFCCFKTAIITPLTPNRNVTIWIKP
ncbi:hypothetical protein HDU87_001440 [Geranomyces variabilis]|uniref:Uncharacterized protein n=1 Tax=Geranomyces variabilis TaxID=109894 RepID=A0AAD5TBH6_9FUNG|nr:hypothetical protein HDU87_001440 [Geranomyces variabilis]